MRLHSAIDLTVGQAGVLRPAEEVLRLVGLGQLWLAGGHGDRRGGDYDFILVLSLLILGPRLAKECVFRRVWLVENELELTKLHGFSLLFVGKVVALSENLFNIL